MGLTSQRVLQANPTEQIWVSAHVRGGLLGASQYSQCMNFTSCSAHMHTYLATPDAEIVPHCSQGLCDTGLTLVVSSQACHFLSSALQMLQNNVAELQVHVAGSSIAMLQGQRPPFRLLVRATGVRDGRRVEYVKPVVSDAFVVSLLLLSRSSQVVADLQPYG